MGARNRIVAVLKPMFAWVREHPVLCLLVGLLVGLLAVFGAVMASGAPEWAYGLFGAEEKFRVLEFVGVAMGGVLLAIGATIAHKRAVALERAAEAQAGAATAQAAANKGAEDGRRQERLKNAIEHLGHASDSVRLGGAYELFHLAQDTEDLRQTVMDILCAHIRRTTRKKNYRKRHEWRPSEEVQSLLNLLFIQNHNTFTGCSINLRGSWLKGAILSNAHLEKSDLFEAHMERVELIGARMQGASLYDAWMKVADLEGAHLQGADLSSTRMRNTVLIRAQMQGAYLSRTSMESADLTEAHMQGATFNLVSMQNAILVGARMHGVGNRVPAESFSERIREAINRESNLSGVTFKGGLIRRDVDARVDGLPDVQAEFMRKRLEPHVDKPASHELPESSGAITGTYTEQEAERWIAEYEEAMGECPEAGEG